ncbi:MAG: NUDIX domain-containing protein [Thermoflexaceae bacterium]|nr:NUDIX domain-containing protein [Thermoflexaceae bacterium]
MRDIQIKEDESVFNCRVAGVIVKNNMILLNRLKNDDFWTCVGGKVAFGESTEESIIREYREETGVNIRIEHLSAIVENFFEFNSKQWHEFLFFYELKDENGELDFFEGERKIKDNANGVYKWFDLNELESIKMQPECSYRIIKNITSQNIQHIINRDN